MNTWSPEDTHTPGHTSECVPSNRTCPGYTERQTGQRERERETEVGRGRERERAKGREGGREREKERRERCRDERERWTEIVRARE